MVSKSNRTQRNDQTKITKPLENIYISPTEVCNLACKYCYVQKNLSSNSGARHILSNKQILDFINKYSAHLNNISLNLKSILFCGGEVFLLPKFTKLVNTLIQKGIFITIITNGTTDKLNQIKNPNNCQLIVSIDGPKPIHDQNRGKGNFAKSKKFISHALKLGFPVEIFYLVTKISYPHLKSFNLFDLPITYLTDRLGSLTKNQTLNIKQTYPTYPSKNFGCFQLAVQSDGFIYGCCESSIKLAHISDPPQTVIENFLDSLKTCQQCNLWRSEQFLSHERLRTSIENRGSPKVARTAKIRSQDQKICHGCCQPNFLCGYTQELDCHNCQQVAKLLNN